MLDLSTKKLEEKIQNLWVELMEQLPSILAAILLLILGIFIIRKITKVFGRFLKDKTIDPLVTGFLINIASIVLTLILISTCLGMVGMGSVTNKILAGAGITTFVIGFALKDIGENFLAGIIMAFRRPFRLGDTIRIQGISGKVKRMSLRETCVMATDGKEIYVPNSIILNNPLENHSIGDRLNHDICIQIQVKYLEKAQQRLLALMKETPYLLNTPEPKVSISKIQYDCVTLCADFWIDSAQTNPDGTSIRSELFSKAIRAVEPWIYRPYKDGDYSLPSDL